MKEIKKRKTLEMNENENTMLQNLWGAAKAALRLRNFIMIQSYLRKQEKYLINNIILYLKQLEKEEKTKPKDSRRKENIKIRAEINKIVKFTEKINETKRWLFENAKKIDKSLARLIKKKEKGPNQQKSEMKMETLKTISQKHK